MSDLSRYQDPEAIQRVLHTSKTIAIVGLSKNAGKTTVLNHLTGVAVSRSLPAGVVSIGVDGEERDHAHCDGDVDQEHRERRDADCVQDAGQHGEGDEDAEIVEPAPGDGARGRHEPLAPRLSEAPRAFQDRHVARVRTKGGAAGPSGRRGVVPS